MTKDNSLCNFFCDSAVLSMRKCSCPTQLCRGGLRSVGPVGSQESRPRSTGPRATRASVLLRTAGPGSGFQPWPGNSQMECWSLCPPHFKRTGMKYWLTGFPLRSVNWSSWASCSQFLQHWKGTLPRCRHGPRELFSQPPQSGRRSQGKQNHQIQNSYPYETVKST